MCWGFDDEYIYQDPKTQSIVNEKGHVFPKDTTKKLELTPEEYAMLKDKYGLAKGTIDRD